MGIRTVFQQFKQKGLIARDIFQAQRKGDDALVERRLKDWESLSSSKNTLNFLV